ncbi:MAG: acyl carrier protein, partial [Clostridia bacterium]|nr:acyl carrier protein [Clostridia bacterium]
MDNLERLKKLFTEVFGEDIDANAITPNDRLAEDLQMNSIGYLYMALAIENEFGIRLT